MCCTEILHSSLKGTQQIPHAIAGTRYCTPRKRILGRLTTSPVLGKKVSTVSASLSSNKQIILCCNDTNELNHGLVINCSLLDLRDKSHFIQPSQCHRQSHPGCRAQQAEGAELNMTGALVSCCAICVFHRAAPIAGHSGWAHGSYRAELSPEPDTDRKSCFLTENLVSLSDLPSKMWDRPNLK